MQHNTSVSAEIYHIRMMSVTVFVVQFFKGFKTNVRYERHILDIEVQNTALN